MTALYRLSELELGKIIIDDIDISTLGLKIFDQNYQLFLKIQYYSEVQFGKTWIHSMNIPMINFGMH